MFINEEITTQELPQVEQVDWHDMDPRLMRRLQAEAGIATFFVVVLIGFLTIIFSVAFGENEAPFSFGALWIIPVIVAVVLFTWPLLSVPKRGYAIRDKDILYKAGVFWHTVTAVPFNRIQHVEKSSTPLDRRFELASLQLFTAGGSGGDLKIHGLSAERAEKVRTFILEKVGKIVEHH